MTKAVNAQATRNTVDPRREVRGRGYIRLGGTEMKRDGSKIQKLRALVVELNVAAEDVEEYNNVENDEFYMLPSIVRSVSDIVRAELRKVEEEQK